MTRGAEVGPARPGGGAPARSARLLRWSLAAAALALVALDLLRADLGPGLRPAQVAALAVAFASGGALLRRRGGWGEAVPVLALALLLAGVYLEHSRRLESDGILYYTYLRSLLFDGDLRLDNDYEVLGWAAHHQNVLPIGAPLLWSPLLVLVHLLWQAGRLLGLPPPTGAEGPYQSAAALASLAYGAAGLFLLLRVLRRLAEGWGSEERGLAARLALWTAVLCWFGSPLRFYLSVLPGFAHAAEFFAAVLVLTSWLRLRERRDLRSAALCGAACGVVFLTRSQDGLLLGLPLAELLLRARRRGERRAAVLSALAVLGGFVLCALPQLAVWQAMFGVPLLVPHATLHGSSFMHLGQPQLWGTLLSPRGGLLVNYPVQLLALVGLAALVRREGRYVACVVPVLLAGWYVNSTVFDWYQVRRFTGLVPLVAPGLAFALLPLARAGHVPLALLSLLALQYDVAVDARRSLPGEPVPVRAAVSEMADRSVASAYAALEPRAPRLAVRLLASYTGEELLSESVSVLELGGESPLLRLPRPARNLSGPAAEEGEPARWVRDTSTRLFLPLGWSGPVVVTVRARALETVEPQAMSASWNGRPLGRRPTEPAWRDYRFDVPAEAVRLGTNELEIAFDRGPIFRRTRGHGPREVRPAALASVTLHRGRGPAAVNP